MIKIKTSGSFTKTESFLKKLQKADIYSSLSRYGQEGVDALSKATPSDSGASASSWSYEIENKNGRYSLIWKNSNMAGNIPVVILLQYGHGTGTGGYVQGRDFINPVIQPLFDRIADDVWKVVRSS